MSAGKGRDGDVAERLDPAGIVVRITVGVILGGILGVLIPWVLVTRFNYGVTGTGAASQMKTLFGFLLYTVPGGGIAGGFLAKRWNRALAKRAG